MHRPAPHAHKVTIREKATGRVFETWPVDARELVRHPAGEYEYVTDAAPTATADTPVPAATPSAPSVTSTTPPPALTIAEQLGAWSYKDLQTLAKRAGLAANQKQPDLIAALSPHVAARTISLEELPKLALDPVQFPTAAPAE